jgi:pilus assembly protein Flp/PilA
MKEGVIMLYLMMLLNQLKMDAFRFKKDEDGAALIEYTVLLGILIVAVIATIGLVGAWINGQWHALQSQLS